jgi:hypothetical protein
VPQHKLHALVRPARPLPARRRRRRRQLLAPR